VADIVKSNRWVDKHRAYPAESVAALNVSSFPRRRLDEERGLDLEMVGH